MRKLKKQLIIVFFICAALLIAFAYWYTAPNNNATIATRDNTVFSKQHLISIKKDSVINFIKTKYGAEVEIVDKEKLTIKLSGQGTRLSSFYNNNGNLLKVKDEGFSIVPNTYQGSLEAQFKKQKQNNIEFVELPTDVLTGIIQQ